MKYFNDNKSEYELNTDNEKFYFKKIHYIFIGLSAIIIAFGFIMFLSSMQLGSSDNDYKLKLNQPQILAGDTGVVVYDEKIFVYSEYLCSVDVFNKYGDFLYALQITVDQNGISYMYLCNDNIYILSRYGTIFRYDLEGNYLGRCESSYLDDDSVLIKCFDRLDNEMQIASFDSSFYELAFFDENSIQCISYDENNANYYNCIYKNGAWNKQLSEFDEFDNIAKNIDGALFCDYSENFKDYNGNEYYTFLGDLIKADKNGISVTLYDASAFDWYRNTPIACWLTAALGFAGVGLTSVIAKKKFKMRIMSKS